MSVLVVVRRRAQPGLEEQAIEEMMRRVADRSRNDRRSRLVWVFQAVDDPAQLLYTGVWPSIADYWQRQQSKPAAQLDALCVGPPERYFFERLRTVEVASLRAHAVDCTFVQLAPAEGATAERFLLEDSHRAAQHLPGFVLHALYRGLDPPSLRFVMHGWESLAALERFRHEVLPALVRELSVTGATVTLFAGRARGGAAGLPHGLYTWRA